MKKQLKNSFIIQNKQNHEKKVIHFFITYRCNKYKLV